MSLRIVCPRCRARLTTPEEAAGRLAPCPRCRRSFRVVDPGGVTADFDPDGEEAPPPAPLAYHHCLACRHTWSARERPASCPHCGDGRILSGPKPAPALGPGASLVLLAVILLPVLVIVGLCAGLFHVFRP